MNFQLIGQLIGLRYKLLWAKTRTRNGRIALFMSGYLLVLLFGGMLASGGLGAGAAAVRSGHAEAIAQAVLTGLFATAVITAVTLGFGVNAAFSDAELRRYPLNARERLFARHFTGMADPFWFLFLALELGLALGLYLYGASSLMLGILAVLLLYACNYLAAQAAGLAIARLEQQKGGSVLLPLAIIVLCLLPGLAAPALAKSPAAMKSVVAALRFTPGFGAGSLMTRVDLQALYGLGILAAWLLALTALVVVLERRPATARATQSAKIHWDTIYARIGAIFGPSDAPLVAHFLQFYPRCKRFRISYLASLPLIPFLLLMWTRQSGPRGNPFASTLGIMAIAGMAPAAAFIVNQFGYGGSGFRRYFLFPTDPAAALRASSYALITLCLVPFAMAVALDLAFLARPYGVRGFAMMLASGIFGLFAFHAVGLWTTLFGARKCDPSQTMGNDLSLMGNLVVVGGMLLFMMGPGIAGRVWKNAITPDYWWVAALLAISAAFFYFVSLRRATGIISARRERLLAIVEGRA